MMWKVKKACLKPAIEEPAEDGSHSPPQEISPARPSSYVNWKELKKVHIVFALEYDGQANKLKRMLPQASMKVPHQLNKDVIAQV